MSSLGLLGGVLERLHLTLAPDELRPAPNRALQPRSQRPQARHFVHVDRLADAFDPAGAERLELEVAFDEFPNTLADHNRARRRERLQARGQTHRMANG